MGIEVPPCLLEDIFGLLGCLGGAGGRGGPLRELGLRTGRLRGLAAEAYLLAVGDATEDERRGLREWVADGNSAYDNPWSLCDESGRAMDFINGLRTCAEMAADPSGFLWGAPDAGGGGDWEEGTEF